LLSVLWSGQHVLGSPFKVNVMSASDPSKVICSGNGLQSIIHGREGSVLIDARTAGPGLYSAAMDASNNSSTSTKIMALKLVMFIFQLTDHNKSIMVPKTSCCALQGRIYSVGGHVLVGSLGPWAPPKFRTGCAEFLLHWMLFYWLKHVNSWKSTPKY